MRNNFIRMEEYMNVNEEHEKLERYTAPSLDFIIAGFPKCGTSTLLYSLGEHDDVEMRQTEYCALGRNNMNNSEAIEAFNVMAKEEFQTQLIHGIKCPVSLRFPKFLERLEMINENAKLVIGVRHPVLFFQSYYNYRVVSTIKGKKLPIPDIRDLVGGSDKAWRGVYTGYKFEDKLMQLGKVHLDVDDMTELAKKNMSLSPTPLKVFLYDVSQLQDPDKSRNSDFRSDLQQFLGIEKKIEPFGMRNVVANQGNFSEMVDICEDKYKDLRVRLCKQGEKSFHWIRDKFLT
eukprot:CAMPEP_0198301492 /NCGR_PEP_ID=MMETSP1449-20131203/51829_1 /TAXON_ID=420275 /ORGANISM="Attheya septentrionalis, Strain CCMP2084" /LENGTH=288 /DNA_ID=CAMNT_0044003589 /DNA_START=268 /DNA_END=1131 /DNA_ORIENTATION=+